LLAYHGAQAKAQSLEPSCNLAAVGAEGEGIMSGSEVRRSRTQWLAVRRLAVLILTAGLSVALAPAVGGGAADTTPPKVEASVGFLIGSVVRSSWAFGDPSARVEGRVDLSIDQVGAGTAQSWNVTGITASDPYPYASGLTRAAESGFEFTWTDYEDDQGGGSNELYAIEVTARNGAGESTVVVAAGMDVTQEDGTNARDWAPVIGTVKTKGIWQDSNCNCFLAGKTIKTNKKGNWVEFTVTVEAGQIVAVVMPMAPNRGEARIKLDGVNRGAVDTHSEVKQNRVVMWQTPPLAEGTHTIRVINLATEGHPRIDVDAFMTTQPLRPELKP
jgi:hypothetical protein